MAFTPKDWRDWPDITTPLDAAAIEDIESRGAAYAESVGVHVGVGPGTSPNFTKLADFETGTFSQVDSTGVDGTFGAIAISTAKAASGTHSVLHTSTGGNGVGYSRVFWEFDGSNNLVEGTDLWAEIKIWIPTTWLTDKQSSVDFLRFDSYVSDDGATLWPSNEAMTLAITQFSNGASDTINLKSSLKDDSQQKVFVTAPSSALTTNAWNTLKMHVVLSTNSALGFGELWINDVSKGSSSGQTLYGIHPVNRLRGGMVATGGGQTNTLTMYSDDFRYGVSDIATGSPGIVAGGDTKLWRAGAGDWKASGGLALAGNLTAGGTAAFGSTVTAPSTSFATAAITGNTVYGGDTILKRSQNGELAVRDNTDAQYRDLRVRGINIQRLITQPRITGSHNTGAYTIPNNAWTTVDIDQTTLNADGVGDVLQISQPGDYIQVMRACLVNVTAMFRWAASATGSRGVSILRQDSTPTSHESYINVNPASVTNIVSTSAMVECSANDRIQMQAFQDSGSALGPAGTGVEYVALRVVPVAA